MFPKSVPASDVLKVVLSLGNTSQSQVIKALESQGLLNDGVRSLIKGSKDLTSDLARMGDSPIEESFHHMSDFVSPKNIEFFTEKLLPGVIGGAGAIEMGGHLDETFGTDTYKKLYKDLETDPNTSPEGMSVFEGDKIIENGPYGRTRWSSSRRKKVASVDEDIAKLLPSYTAKNVMAKFQSQAFQALPPNQKLAVVDRTLRDLTKELTPLMQYLKKMGFNVYDES
jgi:hypothetical protein